MRPGEDGFEYASIALSDGVNSSFFKRKMGDCSQLTNTREIAKETHTLPELLPAD